MSSGFSPSPLPQTSGRDAPAAGQARSQPLIDELEKSTDPTKIVTKAPAQRYRLNFLDVTCLLINRMIGTGIFESPQILMIGTNSTGVTLLFWFAGVIYCLAAAHVYVEYGLNVPRYIVARVEQSVPRSGGYLNYLQYVYSKPRYKKDTVLLIGCLFGISFICVRNMAGNCILCAVRLLQAAYPDQEATSFGSRKVRGIAIAIAVFACFIYSFSRRRGILLNNILALVKVGILLLLIGMAYVVVAGMPNEFHNNTSPSTAFVNTTREANRYISVLGEISKPRKTFPHTMFTGVGSVSLLYIAVNLCYICSTLRSSHCHQFFDKTFGVLSSDLALTRRRVFNAFLAISSFGNIVVMTYTAARIKQEIAKQGFLPWAKFLNTANHSEQTPVGAFVLHFFSCLVLIFATYDLDPDDAYKLLSGLIAYLTTAFFGFFLALGILILYFYGPPITEPHNKGQPARFSNQKVAWYLVPVISFYVLGFSALWFVGFLTRAYIRKIKRNEEFELKRHPEFDWANGGGEDGGEDHDTDKRQHGGLVLIHETIYISWKSVGMDGLASLGRGATYYNRVMSYKGRTG
ncbi:amino acid permease-domain-containing protein [Corynascus novoguineensis]|uniref:Amino acid permease-domain-containing protein n=1 Tax=Corynascus novoguineensis TaxID=1126955 RepID=A0AAN7HIK8_9PEZI|nr:amino acid permease-domain-containing protein [Corynascus novoguineensis]